jgi:hypothetical protein
VLVAKDYLVPAEQHGVPKMGRLPMPCLIVGQLGRGRVVVNNLWPPRGPGIVPVPAYDVTHHLSIGEAEYYLRILRWLVSPQLDLQT